MGAEAEELDRGNGLPSKAGMRNTPLHGLAGTVVQTPFLAERAEQRQADHKPDYVSFVCKFKEREELLRSNRMRDRHAGARLGISSKSRAYAPFHPL